MFKVWKMIRVIVRFFHKNILFDQSISLFIFYNSVVRRNLVENNWFAQMLRQFDGHRLFLKYHNRYESQQIYMILHHQH